MKRFSIAVAIVFISFAGVLAGATGAEASTCSPIYGPASDMPVDPGSAPVASSCPAPTTPQPVAQPAPAPVVAPVAPAVARPAVAQPVVVKRATVQPVVVKRAIVKPVVKPAITKAAVVKPVAPAVTKAAICQPTRVVATRTVVQTVEPGFPWWALAVGGAIALAGRRIAAWFIARRKQNKAGTDVPEPATA